MLLNKANRELDDPPYNLVIHSSPTQDSTNDHYHWHIEFMPKLTKTAGFEWGTGFYINPTPPEEAAKFLREVVKQLTLCGTVLLFRLEIGGRTAALNLAFRLRGTLSTYLTAFEPEFEALGVGRILLYECIAYAFALGFQRWDFLRGDEPYKSWWGAKKIPKCRIQLTRWP